MVVIEGPLTAAEVAVKLGSPRSTVNYLFQRAVSAGLVSATDESAPRYALTL